MRSCVQAGLCIVVAFFVALRVVAHPLALGGTEPGIVALCSGGQIIYVSLDTGQPVGTDKTADAANCPVLGKALVNHASPYLDFVAQPARFEPTFHRHAGPPAILDIFSKYAPRAPPHKT